MCAKVAPTIAQIRPTTKFTSNWSRLRVKKLVRKKRPEIIMIVFAFDIHRYRIIVSINTLKVTELGNIELRIKVGIYLDMLADKLMIAYVANPTAINVRLINVHQVFSVYQNLGLRIDRVNTPSSLENIPARLIVIT